MMESCFCYEEGVRVIGRTRGQKEVAMINAAKTPVDVVLFTDLQNHRLRTAVAAYCALRYDAVYFIKPFQSLRYA